MESSEQQPSLPGPSYNTEGDPYAEDSLFVSEDDSCSEYQDNPGDNNLYDEEELFVQENGSNQLSAGNPTANGSHSLADDNNDNDDDNIPPPAKKRKVSTGGKSQVVKKSASKSGRSKTASGSKEIVHKAAVKGDDAWAYLVGYNPNNPPLSSVPEWFQDITSNGVALGLPAVIEHLKGRPLRVATMCSGTESPILALSHVCQNLSTEFSLVLEFEHVFSGEIVPYKQAFIERNYKPPIIFRDITELSRPVEDDTIPRTATTAYGGKVVVPDNLDLLIAGFVCSDYSHLNNRPKVIEDRGESGDTFFAIKDYCEKYTPKLVILENVISVPWTDEKARNRKNGTGKERGLDSHFTEIGYIACHVILDTKNYYVPQTRQRGYLIAVHRASFTGSDAELSSLISKWKTQLTKDLSRPASVPAECLLLKSDDPKLKTPQAEEPDQKKKATEWERCKQGHEQYRLKIKIGPERPVTNWAAGGFKQLLDYTKLFKGATERVLDTLDIAHLRGILRGYDDRYFDRLLELSQNCYRITDTTRSGLTPCITPTGFPWMTIRGGGTTGYEALLFQALDTNSLDTTNLTQVELRNLAGNAMTSTVVGAVLVASLNVFHKVLQPGTGAKAKEPRLLPDLVTVSQPVFTALRIAEYNPLSVDEAQKLASVSCRLCYCEGRTEVTTGPFQRCTICMHTSCTKCGRKPEHSYESYVPNSHGNLLPRITPFNCEEQLKQYMSGILRVDIGKSPDALHFLHTMRQNCPQDIDEDTWLSTVEAAKKALSSDVYYREMVRRESVHVHFSTQLVEGLGARLELVISDRRIELLLYATVPSAEPLGSKRRKYLEKYALARLRPQGNDIFKGTWDFNMPEPKLVHAVIKAKGDLVDSYKVKVGLEDLAEKTRVWNKFSLEFASDDNTDSFEVDITGDYEHSPKCGQAYDSLHIRVGSKDSLHPTFMLFDHEKSMRNPLLDSFVFTDDPRRLEYREYRPIFGRLDPKFHPSGSTVRVVDVNADSADANSIGDTSINIASTPGYEEGQDEDSQDEENQDEDGLSPLENTTHSDDKAIEQTNDAPDSKRAKKSRAKEATNATAELTVLLDEAITERTVVIYRDNQWVSCPQISLTPLETCNVEYHHLEVENTEQQDLQCISQRAIFWCTAQNTCSFNNRWVRGKWIELNKSTEELFFKEFRWLLEKCRVIRDHCTSKSNWHPALSPEQACHSCAPKYPTLLWTYTSGNKQAPFEDPSDASIYEHRVKDRPQPLSVRYQIDNDGRMQIQVGMNSTTLIHRALGQLALTGSTKNIEVSWRLITDDDPLSKPLFAPLVLLSSEHENPAPQPTGVTKHTLRIEQLKNLAWAINQERHPQPFVEEFIVEDRITHLKYRAEGKAARKLLVPSGILAHEVGFGKTLMVLSLLDSQSDWDKEYATSKITGRLAAKATVVFCPPHLASQWQSEAQKFLPGLLKGELLCVNTFQKLKGLTIKEIQEAKLIIVNWNVLQGESYILALAQFAGMVEPDTSASDRAIRSWYARALEMIGQNVEELKIRPNAFRAHINNQFTKDVEATRSTHAVIPSKRLTGAAYKSSSSAPTNETTSRQRKQPSKAPSLKERADTFNLANIKQGYMEVKCPLLELFSFARVVIDEYTYLADSMKQAYTILELIGARHKWLLSGTPALSGFGDIKQIAKLIGVNLGVDDYTLMKSDVLSRERKAMTRSEEFLMYRDAPSPAWQEHRHRHAQAFLNHFVRKDTAIIGEISSEEHFFFIDQPAGVKATYHELMQYLTDATYDLTKRVKSQHHKSKLIHDALFQCQDAEEVLIQRAAASHTDLVEGAAVSIDSLCDMIIELRMDDYLQTKEKLAYGYKVARWINDSDEYDAGFFESFQKNVKEDRLGDSETANDIKALLLDIEQEPPIEPPGLPEGQEDIPTLRQLSISLGTLFTKLIDMKRSLRFAQGVQDSRLNLKNGLSLSCFKCGNTSKSSEKYFLLSQCGHMVCNRCLPGHYDACHGPTCLAGNSHYNKLPVKALVSGESSTTLSKAGKIYDVVDYIKNQIPRDEKVLVFVQFPKLFKAVEAALKEDNIDFCDIRGAVGSWKVLSQFQKAGNGSKRVMILNIGDASASGSNLTMANHVIFVSPYHTKGSNAQYTYDAAMTQAVGRARRFGQQKTVHVYHFLVKYTADIDIMELRTSCILGTDAGENALSIDGSREGSKFGTAFYNHISRDSN